MEIIKCFEIVPIGDNIHYLCLDCNGVYFKRHKADSDERDRLIFESEALAQDYINKYLDKEKYKPEYIIFNIDYLPNNIINEV